MREKVQRLLNRLIEVEELLGHPEILSDQKKYRVLTQEHSQLADLKDAWDRLQRSEKELDENRQLESLEKNPAMLIFLQ